jgi:hypothetical protein
VGVESEEQNYQSVTEEVKRFGTLPVLGQKKGFNI